MKKRFIFWLCRRLGVTLVEPTNRIIVKSKILDYKQVQVERKISFNEIKRLNLSKQDLEALIKEDVISEIYKVLIEGKYADIVMFENSFSRDTTIRASFFVAKK